MHIGSYLGVAIAVFGAAMALTSASEWQGSPGVPATAPSAATRNAEPEGGFRSPLAGSFKDVESAMTSGAGVPRMEPAYSRFDIKPMPLPSNPLAGKNIDFDRIKRGNGGGIYSHPTPYLGPKSMIGLR